MELDEAQDFDQLLQRMARTSFQARNLGRAADVLELMFSEPHNLVVLTISGALTVAQQGSIFMEPIRSGLVQAVVGTGALLTHDVVENMGFSHYEAPATSDQLVPALSGGEPEGSAGFCRRLGQLLLEHFPQRRNIASAATEAGVPVCILARG